MLTQAAAKAAAPRGRGYKLAAGGGLHLHVTPAGCKSWRLKYHFAGREKLLVIGRFPELSPAEARERRDRARTRLGEGIDPGSRVDIEVNNFEQLARAWHGNQAQRWSPAHAAQVLATFERDVFPAIGARPPGAVTAPELLNVIRSLEKRGCGQTARRLRERLSAVFGYAIALGLTDIDPAAKLGRALAPAPLARPMPALATIAECRALLAACDRVAGGHLAVLASRFLALTAVRLEALRGARWEEFEQLGGPEPVWRVPAARMKLARAKKGLARFDHLVPLSVAAVAVLAELRKVQPANADCSGLVFPGRGNSAHPELCRRIGENALRDLYAAAGFSGRHVPHGWRASFSTILNELEPGWRGDIDRALAHSPKDKVEAAYNRAAQLGRRRAVFERWGELLSG